MANKKSKSLIIGALAGALLLGIAFLFYRLGHERSLPNADNGLPKTAPPVSTPEISNPPLNETGEAMKKTIVTPHLKERIYPGINVLWCSTFQLAWNELCRVAGEDVHLDVEPPMVALLNGKSASKEDIDAASCLVKSGAISGGIIQEIRQSLEAQFKGQADPKLLSPSEGLPRDSWVFYAYLLKKLLFKQTFTRFPYHLRFGKAEVACWGIHHSFSVQEQRTSMAEQVVVLDYQSDDDFILQFRTKSKKDRLILAKAKPFATLAETVVEVRQRAYSAHEPNLTEEEILEVPLLDFDVLRDYQELARKQIIAKNAQFNGWPIALALQRIRFRLNETGALLESEAEMSAALEMPLEERRTFIFDKPFLILLEREGGKNPYFALWVGNAELLVPFSPPKG